MKLDIVIPIYNGEKYIHPLLDAFRAQSDSRFKLIIVNDGSTDDTEKYLHDPLQTRDLDILVINQSNGGVGAARNRGAKEAFDDLIVFFDADDLPEKNYVETIIKAFSKDDIDCFVFQRISVDPSNKVIAKKLSALEDGIYSNEKVLISMFMSDIDVCVFTVALRLKIFRDNKLKCPEKCKNLEDVHFSYQMIAASPIVEVSNKVLYRYLVQLISATTKYNVFTDWEKSLAVMNSLQGVFDEYKLEFADIYRKWGTARIIWTITWQSVCIATSYNKFKKFTNLINSNNYLRRLYDFPRKYVSCSSKLFYISPFAFYIAVKIFGNKRNRSKITDSIE